MSKKVELREPEVSLSGMTAKQISAAIQKPVAPVERVHKVMGYWHKLGCDGKCFAIAGCASQWQPEEIASIKSKGRKPLTFGAGIPDEGHPCEPKLRSKTSAERKGEPIHSGVMLYFPDALAAVARISKAGNDKHNPGEPLHWARGKSMDQMDASARHMLTLGAVDEESKELEAAHNAWRALAQLQLLEEKRLRDAGIMPYSGIVT